MSDTVIITIIALLYSVSSGGIYFLSSHFLINDERISRFFNLPFSKMRDEDVSDILQIFKNINDSLSPTVNAKGLKVFDNDKQMLERYYDNIAQRQEKRNEILSLSKKLKSIRIFSCLNIVFSIVIILYIIYCLVAGCISNAKSLSDVINLKLNIFEILFLLPWGFFLLIFSFAKYFENRLVNITKIF